MPIYEYQCTGCHHTFDLLQKFSDEPVKKCPKCTKDTVVRLVSAAGFQLKGSGWYATDFKDKGKSEHKTADKPAADATTHEKKTSEPAVAAPVSKKGESD